MPAFHSPLLLVALTLCSFATTCEAFSLSPAYSRHSLSRTTKALYSTPLDASAAAPSVTAAVNNGEQQQQLEVGSTYVRCGKCQTVYTLTADDLGPGGKGRRLECSVCSHSWFQSKDRLLTVQEGFTLVPLPQEDLTRIQTNIVEGKAPNFMGELKVYVGNIAFDCHEDDLHQLFSQVAEVGEVSLVRDAEGKNRGFGFVTMRTKEGGLKAIEQLDGAPVRGRQIAVRESTN
jgi:predicted Zn finger-like uncharacterized protein